MTALGAHLGHDHRNEFAAGGPFPGQDAVLGVAIFVGPCVARRHAAHVVGEHACDHVVLLMGVEARRDI